jgi:predicted TPR repeat methyltransferase
LQKNWSSAERYLKQASALDPHDIAPLVVLGDAYATQGKAAECARAFMAARAVADVVMVHEHEGMALLTLANPQQAEERFRRVLELDSAHARAKTWLARALLLQDRVNDAAPLLEAERKRDAHNHEAFGASAALEIKRGARQLAMDYLRHAYGLRADRNDYAMGLVALLKEHGYLDEALVVLRSVLAREPENLWALNSMAYLLVPLGRSEEALGIITKILADHPDNPSLQHLRNAITGNATDAPDDSYVQLLFDEYADKFDHHLVNLLSYQTPQVMADLITRTLAAQGMRAQELSLLDLGCGTGLSGEVLAAMTRHRVGVDLSPKMLEKAAQKNVYQALHAENIVEFLHRDDASYDLITAMDVLVYIGNLKPLFEAVPQRLSATGILAISVENGDDAAPFTLRSSGRYAHAAPYVESLASAVNLKLLAKESTILRKEGRNDMQGYLYVFGV